MKTQKPLVERLAAMVKARDAAQLRAATLAMMPKVQVKPITTTVSEEIAAGRMISRQQMIRKYIKEEVKK